MTDFPYTEYRVNILMEEPKRSTERNWLIKMYKERIKKARELSIKIEEFIDSIDDSGKRLVFQYRFIDGHGVSEVADMLSYTKGRISQIISEYVQD